MSVYDRVSGLTVPEQAYIARWTAITRPEIAAEGLEALAAYRRDHPDEARALLGLPGAGAVVRASEPPGENGSDEGSGDE